MTSTGFAERAAAALRRRISLNQHMRLLARRPHPPLTPLPPDPSIEIVVPCYNHASFLPAALASVVGQTHAGRFGLALADDASTDETPQVIAGFLADLRDERIAARSLRHERNLRQWGSLNRAVDTSTADLIMVLNDDDLLLEDALEKMLGLFAAHPAIGIAGAHSLWLTGDDPVPAQPQLPLTELVTRHTAPRDARGFRALDDLAMTHSSSTFRRDAWAAVGGYRPKPRRIDPDAHEDRDFQMRVAAFYPAVTLPDYALAVWRTDSTHGPSF